MNFQKPVVTTITSCLVEDKSLVEWCLSRGGDPNASSPSKTTVLHRAASIGSVGTLEVLIAAGGQIKSPCPSDDVVAEAVSSHYESNDRIAAIHCLLDHGADIDAYWGQNYDLNHPLKIIMGRQTALHIAIGNRDQSLVEMLLKRGADSSKPMWNYSTAYRTLKEHAGAPHWREHINMLSPIEYARFLGFEDIELFLENFSE
jgi:ankyrin repeat protein